ncbi:MAG: HD domain-containing protein [Candidatus Sulfobium sp.]|jgi:HD-GYP domain-containing protein (c-di-GMP phosphodiesterase class II)
MTERALYNSFIIDSYVKYLRSKYPDIEIAEILSDCGIMPYQVADHGHWFTQEEVDRFYEEVLKRTGNKNIAREAGRFAASAESLGFIRQYILGLVGPGRAYEMIGKFSTYFTKSSRYDSRRIGKHKVEITVTPYKGVNEKPFQCENRIGHLEAIANAFNYRLPLIEHPECMFRNGASCKYVVTWQESHSALWRDVRTYFTVFLSVLFGVVFFSGHRDVALPMLLPLSILALFVLTIYVMHLEKTEVNSALQNLQESSDKLLEEVNSRHNDSRLILELGLAINRKSDLEGIFREVIQAFQNRLDYDRGLILLPNHDRSLLIFHAGFGYSSEQYAFLKKSRFHLQRAASKGAFVVCFKEQKPLLIDDVESIKDNLSRYSIEFARKMGAKSFICCPIVYEKQSLGIIVVDNIRSKRPLLQSDLNLLMSIIPEIAVSMHTIMLFENKERQFRSIIQTLAATIDARDFLTAGHSERVTEYAVGICQELGMPREFTEMIRVAALLHDYGKIAISDAILKKQGPLDEIEFEEIKTHAVKTQQILEKINFEGIYKQIPNIVGSHHEKWDGTGYPLALREEAIPLGSRIIAVADYFEAITSKRHYRDAMSLEDALKLINEIRGTHLDPEVTDAFIRYCGKNFSSLLSRDTKAFLPSGFSDPSARH